MKNESWIDANVFAVPKLADDPQADPAALGRAWINQRLGITDPVMTDALMRILTDSPAMVRDAFYIGPFARAKKDPWHPAADWIQDDLLDAQAAWRMIQEVDEDELDAVVREKQAATDRISADRAALQRAVESGGEPAMGGAERAEIEPLINTMIYAESLFDTLRDLLAGLVAYRRYLKDKSPAKARIARQHLLDAQTHWNHHTQRHGSLPGAATTFREAHFWQLTQQILAELSNQMV